MWEKEKKGRQKERKKSNTVIPRERKNEGERKREKRR
jgi:hypothetical protein